MRSKNQEISDAILKFVNKYYHDNRKAPTISEVADGVGVARSTTHRYMQDLSEDGLLDYDRGILSAPESAKMKTAYIAAPLVGSIQCGCPEEEQEYVWNAKPQESRRSRGKTIGDSNERDREDLQDRRICEKSKAELTQQ